MIGGNALSIAAQPLIPEPRFFIGHFSVADRNFFEMTEKN